MSKEEIEKEILKVLKKFNAYDIKITHLDTGPFGFEWVDKTKIEIEFDIKNKKSLPN